MKALIIKTSSLGDVLHTLPAITDAIVSHPELEIDWLVEESFAEIPAWHPAINRVLPVALRRWRKNPWLAWKSGEWSSCKKRLKANHYDFVIDAQGLLKSAFLARYVRGERYGLDRNSAREGLASMVYHKKIAVPVKQHAVARTRQLFSSIFGYALPSIEPRYGIDVKRLPQGAFTHERYVVFLHGTTWDTKHWPESYWVQLARLAEESGFHIKLPWGNSLEQERAARIAASTSKAQVLPKMKLAEVAGVLSGASLVIAVDTGLGHLAAALEVPTLSLYGPTDPKLTGTAGVNDIHLAAKFACSPCLSRKCQYTKATAINPACFTSLPPYLVWQQAMKHMSQMQFSFVSA